MSSTIPRLMTSTRSKLADQCVKGKSKSGGDSLAKATICSRWASVNLPGLPLRNLSPTKPQCLRQIVNYEF